MTAYLCSWSTSTASASQGHTTPTTAALWTIDYHFGWWHQMKSKARLTKLEKVHRRGRVLMGYEDGPLWHNGVITEPLATDTVIRIVYQAKATDPNVRKLTWGDDTLTNE